jgi:hypothetical protein
VGGGEGASYLKVQVSSARAKRVRERSEHKAAVLLLLAQKDAAAAAAASPVLLRLSPTLPHHTHPPTPAPAQIWDADLLVSDCLAEGQMDLQDAMKTAFNTRELGMEYNVFGESGKQLKAAAARLKMEKQKSEYVIQKPKKNAAVEQDEEPNENTSLLGGERDLESGQRLEPPEPLVPPPPAAKKANKKKKAGMIDGIRGSMGLTAPENSGWLNFSKTNLRTGAVEKRGKVLLGIEILPESLAARRVCGEGREEPNKYVGGAWGGN